MKKSKNTRKILSKLEIKNGFRKPFQIMLDFDMIMKLNKESVNLNLFKSLLCCEPKLVVTTCTFKHYKSQHKYLKFKKIVESMENSKVNTIETDNIKFNNSDQDGGEDKTTSNILGNKKDEQDDLRIIGVKNNNIFKTNREKKEWNKNRFVDDFIRHCEIRKCNCEFRESKNKEIVKKDFDHKINLTNSNNCIIHFLKRKSKDHYFVAFMNEKLIDEFYNTFKSEMMPFISYKGGELSLATGDTINQIKNKNTIQIGASKKEISELKKLFDQ